MPAIPTTDRPAEPLLRVLGPMAARHDGRDLPLGPPRRRALFALLLVRLGRVVPTEVLVEELWGGEPPRQAVATLQSHVSHLRRALRPAAGAARLSVRHRAQGYVLDIDPEHVDVCRFERLVAEGRHLLEGHDPAGARDRLGLALRLWRGSPYAEFDAHPSLYDETTRLEQVRLTALEVHAEARLLLGADEEVAADLDGEARRHPTRERLVGHLMTALSRLGRQAEALEAYERTRVHLAEEFGVGTDAELRRIRTALLTREPEAGPPAAARPAPAARAVAGAGAAERRAAEGWHRTDGTGEAGRSGTPVTEPDAHGPVLPEPPLEGQPLDVPSGDRFGALSGERLAGAPGDLSENRPGDRFRDLSGDLSEAPSRYRERLAGAPGDRLSDPRPDTGTAPPPRRAAAGRPGTDRPAGPSPFTGRFRELDGLTTAVADVRVGHGHVAGVLGPAGMGKTRLLLELAPRLEAVGRGTDGDDGLEVVWSHCFPGEGVPPYWLWTQVLRRLSATRPDAFRDAARPFGALLSPVMPERTAGDGATAGPGSDAGAGADWAQARFLTNDAVCEVLLALAARRPLVLFLEDLHWADTASLDLLRLLSTRRHGHPLAIVLTARDFEVESDATLRRTFSEVLRGPRTETLRLDGLSRRDVAALVRAQAGPGVDAEVIEVLHRRSEGNPYFVMQLLSLLGDARSLHRSDAVDTLLSRVPTGVREALNQRFATLPGPVLRVLRLCAVLGTEVDTDLLHRTVAGDEPVAEALEAAIRAGLLEEDPHHPGRLHFAHALVQETLVGELARKDLHRLHAKIAEALSARRRGRVGDEEIERVAHHTWHAQRALPAERALPRMLQAAEQAEQQLAYERVETWLRRAVHLIGFLPPDETATVRLEQQLHIQLGQVLATTRGYGHPEAEAALAHGRALNPVTRAPEDPSVLWALCAAYLVTGRYDASRQFSGLLRDISRRGSEPVAVLGAAYGEGIVLHVRGMLPQALAELEHGVEMADRYARDGHSLARTFQHDPRVSCRSYNAFTHWLLGDRATATARRRELLRLTAYDSRPSDRSFALYVDAVVAAWEGDAGTALASGAEGVRLAGEHGLLYWKAMLGLLEGWGLTHSAREAEGLVLMHASMDRLRGSRTLLRHPLHLGLLGQAQHHAGRREEARDTFHALLAAVEQRREDVYLHPALPATGLIRTLLGPDGTVSSPWRGSSGTSRPRPI
ncbi:BTAD domain-containing putative transcriptional regulator [Streptomyces sp. AB3(2024)]|uniref:BTAD domain-containing putative transcriptional regulator n=1 Tax=Streptomyces sp. AB3(2024) TaxID=3317321 RepID=UPI0035A3699E